MKVEDRLKPIDRQGERLNKKDRLICFAIFAIYSIVAFLNLGSFDVPQTGCHLSGNDRVVFELKSDDVKYFKYYTGLGAVKFNIFYSEDGEDYRQYELTDEIKNAVGVENDTFYHSYLDMYAWNLYEVDIKAKYIMFDFVTGGAEFLEIAFSDGDNKAIPCSSVTSSAEISDLPNLTDEQTLVPEYTSYMENMYFDEVYHARTAIENIEYIRPYEISHPPLGKILLGIGIRIFGKNPFGWRFMGTLTGALMLPLIYVFAKRIFKKTLYAFIPTFLFAVDFMHFAQTRIATIDSYSVFFIMLMYFFMLEYIKRSYNRDGLKATLLPLGLCGLSFGLGAATKWLCIYAGFGLAIIFFYTMALRLDEYLYARSCLKEDRALPEAAEGVRLTDGERTLYERIQSTYVKNTILTLTFCIGFFIVIPAVIYLASYIPYMLVKVSPYTLKDVWKNQLYMYNYHSHLSPKNPHPFNSRWYTWPLDIRPLYFFQGKYLDSSLISSMSTFGNPAVWIGCLVGAIFLGVLRITREKVGRYAGFIAIAAASEFVPWIFISRETYIYHYFATVPFLMLLATFSAKYIIENMKHGKKIVYAFLGLSLLLFVLFYPFYTGMIVPRWYANVMRWLPSWPFY